MSVVYVEQPWMMLRVLEVIFTSRAGKTHQPLLMLLMDKSSVKITYIRILQNLREISTLSSSVQILSIRLSIFPPSCLIFVGHQMCLAFHLLFFSAQTFHLRRLFLQLMSEFLQPHKESSWWHHHDLLRWWCCKPTEAMGIQSSQVRLSYIYTDCDESSHSIPFQIWKLSAVHWLRMTHCHDLELDSTHTKQLQIHLSILLRTWLLRYCRGFWMFIHHHQQLRRIPPFFTAVKDAIRIFRTIIFPQHCNIIHFHRSQVTWINVSFQLHQRTNFQCLSCGDPRWTNKGDVWNSGWWGFDFSWSSGQGNFWCWLLPKSHLTLGKPRKPRPISNLLVTTCTWIYWAGYLQSSWSLQLDFQPQELTNLYQWLEDSHQPKCLLWKGLLN